MDPGRFTLQHQCQSPTQPALRSQCYKGDFKGQTHFGTEIQQNLWVQLPCELQQLLVRLGEKIATADGGFSSLSNLPSSLAIKVFVHKINIPEPSIIKKTMVLRAALLNSIHCERQIVSSVRKGDPCHDLTLLARATTRGNPQPL